MRRNGSGSLRLPKTVCRSWGDLNFDPGCLARAPHPPPPPPANSGAPPFKEAVQAAPAPASNLNKKDCGSTPWDPNSPWGASFSFHGKKVESRLGDKVWHLGFVGEESRDMSWFEAQSMSTALDRENRGPEDSGLISP